MRASLTVVLAGLIAAACGGPVGGSGPTGASSLATSANADREIDDADVVIRAAELERDLHAKGLVVNDDAPLSAYLDSVARRLAPGKTYRIGVIRDAGVNAMGLANGSIYVFAGTFAAFENEAQLAAQLSHEIAHVALRHAALIASERKSRIVAAQLGDIALLGGVASTYVQRSLAASVAGFSREQEEEADREGLRNFFSAGYRMDEVERALSLVPEATVSAETAAFASHPDIAARMRYLRDLAATFGKGGATVNAEAYRAATRRIVPRAIEWAIGDRRYAKAIVDAERAIGRGGADARLYALGGEAHRRMAEDPEGAAMEAAYDRGVPSDAASVAAFRGRSGADREQARSLFRRALELDAACPTAHRGLGLLAKADGDLETARRELRAYLGSPDPLPDRIFIEKQLEEKS